jgi:hypothetical protein
MVRTLRVWKGLPLLAGSVLLGFSLGASPALREERGMTP